ncbi:MAG: universal stress protein [Nitrospirota bacterium]
MSTQNPISSILLPVDGSEDSKRAVRLAGCLGTVLGKSISGITILRVLTGGYLSRHLGYVDFRAADALKNSEAIKGAREEHIRQNILPLLEETGKMLKDSGVEIPVEKLVPDGDAANEIVRVARERNFSTIVMARRGLSTVKGAILGSVTDKVVHAAYHQTVYIAGHVVSGEKPCPVSRMLIPVDGSPFSMKGVEHAAGIASAFRTSLKEITLLRVVNAAFLTAFIQAGEDPMQDSQKILEESRKTLLQRGIPEEKIKPKIMMGNPPDEIVKEIERENYDLVVIGRKGRTAFRELILGRVSSTVMHRCSRPTIAIVSSE